ncbi:ABC transporter substrate-binding protein [Nocardioides sp. NPDC051685]|uniref:ABC transporter substrate-binding protein n=1 Tax=Nocardioides sp. NPDC051685 TaxID=3364334 RepID=UPI0037B3D175
MPRIPRLAAYAAVFALALSASACSEVQKTSTQSSDEVAGDVVTTIGIGDKEIKEGGTLTMGLSADPDALDPTTSSSLYTRYVMETVCQKLYDIDADGGIVPMLATALPELSEGGLVATFPVKEGVKFADGTPFDAAAVVTTLKRNLTKPDSSRASELGTLSTVEASGPYEVRLRFKEPFSPLTASLADRAGMIMSPTALKKMGDNFADHPTCVGPFKFVDRVPGTSITVEKDPGYYDAENVHLDKIVYRIMTDASIRAANLKSGDVQVADSLAPADMADLRKDSELSMMQVGSFGYQGVQINIGNQNGVGTPVAQIDTPIAKSKAVRQAFSMAVDREQLVQSVFHGYYDPTCSPIADSSAFATDASQACPEHDPAGAKKLLEEAGVTTPLKVTMQTSNTPSSLQFAQALQAQVKAAGFDLRIEPVEYTTLLDNNDRGAFEAMQLGWSGRVDPNGNTFNFLTTGAGQNTMGYSNAEVDKLLTDAASETDTAERADLYGKAIAQVHEDNPIVYLYRQRNLTGLSKQIAGVSVFSDGVVRISGAAYLAG